VAKDFHSNLSVALDTAVMAFRARCDVMSRHNLLTLLKPFGAEVTQAAIVTLEGACLRAAFAERGRPTGRDLLRFDPALERKLRHHRAERERALAQRAIARRLDDSATFAVAANERTA
jgi:hypothetical protein